MPPRPAPPSFDLGLPHFAPWMKWMLGGLAAAYVVELLLLAAGVDVVAWLAYHPLGAGFAPWQLVTRFVLWSPRDPTGILFSLLVVGFLLPDLAGMLGGRRLAEGLGAAAAAGTAAVLAVDGAQAAGWLGTPPTLVLGWGLVPMVLVVWFGLARPGAVVRLYFLIPVQAAWIVWGSLAITLLILLSAFATGGGVLGPVELLGAWLGGYGWWRGRGPGRRRRVLVEEGRKVERKLGKVIQLPPRDGTWH